MSDVKKLKKTKKGMSPETKATLSNVFKGFISNQACVDGGKDSPWWIAVIFLCLSIILPLIPIMVTQSKVYGSQVFSGYNYNVDRGIHNTLKKEKDAGHYYELKDGLLSFYETKGGSPLTLDDNPIQSDLNEYETGKYVINFQLYVTNKVGSELSSFVTEISGHKFESGTCDPYDEAKAEIYAELGTTFYTPSFLVLASNTMGVAAYKYDTTTVGTSSYGGLNWAHTPNGDFIDYVLGANKEETMANFKVVLDQTFIDQKAVSFRTNTLIYFGVYAGLILFLGLMVFILTRGKNNIFNFLSFFKCQRIAWWASLTPAILGMIFAFIFSTNMIGQMSFVVFLALRIMWLSMKQLRPVQ